MTQPDGPLDRSPWAPPKGGPNGEGPDRGLDQAEERSRIDRIPGWWEGSRPKVQAWCYLCNAEHPRADCPRVER
jgi:hypothetical protein